jgi:hypothetical protein
MAVLGQQTLQINSATLGPISGSAPMYACRAWISFNGINPSTREAANVSSLVRNATGDFTINFATAMPSANYAVVGSASGDAGHPQHAIGTKLDVAPTTTAVRVHSGDTGGSNSTGRLKNTSYHGIAIFQ